MFMQSFRQPSVMSHDFSKAPQAQIQRSSFKRSCGYKTTLDVDYLYPIFTDEVLPGDTFNVKLSSVARLVTLMRPIIDNLKMDFFFFFVPNRLLWEHWANFMGEKVNPDDETEYLVPQVDCPLGFVEGSLADYFGLPLGVACYPNALHFRAYNLIWNEWFRDQNLQDRVTVSLADAMTDEVDCVLLKRNKAHDYFTSCLPWPQKGPGVELPLGELAPVITDSTVRPFVAAEDSLYWRKATDGTVPGAARAISVIASGLAEFGTTITPSGTACVPSNLYADLADATAATINSLREAFQLQVLLERDARGGTRYTEIIRSHFGVTSPDSRLQRPEYLGGGSVPITVDPIPSTASNIADDSLVGDLAATAYSNQSGIGFNKSFVEHGVIIGLVNVHADLTYQRGMNKMWTRQTKYDFYWPALAHLGEQEVTNGEIYFTGVKATDDAVFGYQERWAEYRYKPSMITGVLRSTAALSLDLWHLSQDFAALPVLNDVFIAQATPIDRIVSVTDQPPIVFDSYFDIVCTRPMPIYSVPGMIDHF